MQLKDYKGEWDWMNSSEAKQRSDAARAHAISEFKKSFPSADESRFTVQIDYDENRKPTGRVLLPDDDGSWENPLIQDRKYWSQALKDALGGHQDDGFPSQLSPVKQNNPKKPIPAVDFSEKIYPTGRIEVALNNELKIYVTPTEFFTTKFREIF